MENCIFCRIAKKEIPSQIVYEDEDTLAFKDTNPQAPLHVIIIPRSHVAKICDVSDQNAHLIDKLFLVGNRLAREARVTERGYRYVINCNRDAGQTVFHLHLHLLGGRTFSWPPG
ncbi:MAG: histidine triad nucleotide-binding protein [Candidatus Omnitrophota bacterium]